MSLESKASAFIPQPTVLNDPVLHPFSMHGDICNYQRDLPDLGAMTRPPGITQPDGIFGEDTVHFRAI